MTNRFIVALVALVLGANVSFGQTPEEIPAPGMPPITEAPHVITEATPLSSFLPFQFEAPRLGQFWATGDYLFSFVRATNLPILVTTSPPGTPQVRAGVLDNPDTTVVIGGWTNGDLRSGYRLGMGYWFSPEKKFGVETGLMIVERRSSDQFASSTDGTILARPFLNANNSAQNSVLVAFPGSSNGTVDVLASSGGFYSAFIDVTENSYDVGWYRLTSMFGYRFYSYNESLRVRQSIVPTGNNIFPFPLGTQIVNTDNFETRNVFHGIDFGFRSQFFWNDFSLDFVTKLAFGRVSRTFSSAGDQIITAPGTAPLTQNGGVLALASNNGSTSTGDWKAMPEFNLNLNWQIRPNIAARVGYSFILLNGVARAADQVDTALNPNLFSGGNGTGVQRPVMPLIRTDTWVQAINIGLLFTY